MWKYEESVMVAVDTEFLWAIISNVGAWEEWMACATEAASHGEELAVGTEVKAKIPNGTIIEGRIADLVPGVLFHCSAELTGMNVSLIFDIEELEEGCLVRFRITGAGLLAWYYKRRLGGEVIGGWVSESLKNLVAYVAQEKERLVAPQPEEVAEDEEGVDPDSAAGKERE